MKADDLVDVVYVTPHNFLYAVGVSRLSASNQIRVWYNFREDFSKLPWLVRVWRHLRCWLSPTTFAINYLSPETGESFAQWAIGAESIIGIYIKERVETVQEKMARASERMANVLEKEANKGDEWREEG